MIDDRDHLVRRGADRERSHGFPAQRRLTRAGAAVFGEIDAVVGGEPQSLPAERAVGLDGENLGTIAVRERRRLPRFARVARDPQAARAPGDFMRAIAGIDLQQADEAELRALFERGRRQP